MKASAFLLAIIGLVLFSFARFLLPPGYIGAFFNAYGLFVFWMLSILAIVLIYKYPQSAKRLFIISAFGSFLIIALYVMFGFGAQVRWTELVFVGDVLIAGCFLFLYSAYHLNKIKK